MLLLFIVIDGPIEIELRLDATEHMLSGFNVPVRGRVELWHRLDRPAGHWLEAQRR